MIPGRPGGVPRLPVLARLVLLAYRVAVWLYPASFRRRHGRAMVADARELLEGAAEAGLRSVVSAALRLAADAARSLPREWRASGVGGASAHDLRQAARSLRRAPSFTAVVVGVLGVAVAGALTVFVLSDAYLLRSLPYPEADRLVGVEEVVPLPWERAGEVFEIPLTWDLDAFTLVGDGPPEQVLGAWVSPGFFEAFGVRPALGRLFTPDEAGEGGASVVVISHGLWQRRFGGDPDVVGSTVSAYSSDRPDDAETFTVVGVLPEDFWFHNRYTGILAPLRTPNPVYMGRLRRGLSLEEAGERVARLARPHMAVVPDDFTVTLTPFHERYVRGVRPTLAVLGAAVGFVLLIALVNASVLVVVRAQRREREVGVRLALGAGKGRVARQLLAEGLLLAAGAAVVGVALAAGAVEALAEPVQRTLDVTVPGGTASLELGTRGLALSALLCGAAGAVLGLVPLGSVVRGARGPVAAGSGGRGATESRSRRRVRSALVAGELALSLALLVAAGLAVRSARNLAASDLGFEPGGLVLVEVGVRRRSYPDPAERAAFHRRVEEAAGSLPGVEVAGLGTRVPLTWGGTDPVETRDGGVPAAADAPEAVVGVVSPAYFETMGIPVLAGRGFGPGDREGSPPVAVVSRGLARTLWGDADPLGRRLRIGAEVQGDGTLDEHGVWRTVVGVTGDVQHEPGEDAYDLYVPHGQPSAALDTPAYMSLVVRLAEGAPLPVRALRDAVAGLDPTVAPGTPVSLEDAAADALAVPRFLAGVLAAFSAFALALAVVGLYAVVAYAASLRRRDVAVRMALGAARRDVTGLFMRDAAPVLAGGLALGLAGGALLGRVLEARLHGVSPLDVPTYAVLSAVLLAATATAAWVPARRAAAADPMGVLREE